MRPIGRITFKSRTYKDNDGNDKNVWSEVGTLFQREDRSMSIKLDSVPVGEFNGWLNVFEIKKKDDGKSKDVVLDDIDDKPIDLSEISF